jgi:hypothetical protein
MKIDMNMIISPLGIAGTNIGKTDSLNISASPFCPIIYRILDISIIPKNRSETEQHVYSEWMYGASDWWWPRWLVYSFSTCT